MLAVSDQSDFEDFEWLLLTVDMINFWNHAKKATFWTSFVPFLAWILKNNFKRHFLQFSSETFNKHKAWTVQTIDL